ncbi:PRD domain-containing protein [Erwinia sp. CPCC 100877]|nr:PRD domain-containing protein [Erwinia sp. CPCC 100877]
MRKEINDYLYDLTLQLNDVPEEVFSTHHIARSLQLNRSTMSSYLNHAFREDELIKIKSYPTLFLHKQALQDMGLVLEKNTFQSVAELRVEQLQTHTALETVIGASGSLKTAIDQIKTAVMYPNSGLPILLCGASGSGKTYLASKIYDYAIEEKVIEKDAPFIAYNCAQYFNNPELLSSALFGHTKGAFTGADERHSGLLEKAEGGLLFLDEVHRLSEEGQEKLFTFMDTGEFSPMGDNSIRKKANVRLIFATTENIYTAFLPTFLRRLPVIVHLPKFQNRPQSERVQLIDLFFIEESNILSREIQVSYQMMDFLLNCDLEGNVGKIKNIIKYACGSAYVHQKKQELIVVTLQDLPTEYMLKFKEQLSRPKKERAKRKYLPHTKRQIQLESRETGQLREFFEIVLEEFQRLQVKKITTQQFIDTTIQRVIELMDEFIFHESYEKEQSFYEILIYSIRQTFDFMQETYGFAQDGNRVVALANYLYLKDKNEILSSRRTYQAYWQELNIFMDTFMNTPHWYAKKLLFHLSQQLDQPVFEEDILFITFYFHSLHIADFPNEVKSIVLAHGYSTASSLANVANRILGKNIFQAYDMPINITLDKVEAELNRYLSDYRTDAGLILLVDMGSFNQLSERLEGKLTGPLLIIDYVSTPLVLEVGNQVINGKSIVEIYEEIGQKHQIHKQMTLPKVKKKKAILTCCYTGLGSANQIRDIIQKCLGKSAHELTIIPYDYHKLLDNKTFETPFKLYDVLMIIGTEDPKIQQIPYLSLDQLINGAAISEFVTILEQHFELEDEHLEEELIFNFSINKIVENLTILDADKLLRLVQRALVEASRLLEMEFSNNQLFLLYLHCCCMIERILRKESVDEQEDLEEYLQKERSAIKAIHQAFWEIENEYIIQIPDLELRLINDIING